MRIFRMKGGNTMTEVEGPDIFSRFLDCNCCLMPRSFYDKLVTALQKRAISR